METVIFNYWAMIWPLTQHLFTKDFYSGHCGGCWTTFAFLKGDLGCM